MEALISIAISSVVVASVFRGYDTLIHTYFRTTAQLQSDGDVQTFLMFLRSGFGGMKSFQSLSFLIPGSSPPQQSFSAGFYLLPNTDINGNTFPPDSAYPSDLLTFIQKMPLSIEIKLAADVTPGPGPVSLSMKVDPSLYFRDSDLMVISNTQTAEVLIVSNIAAYTTFGGGIYTITPPASWFTTTYTTGGPATLSNTYIKGDHLFRAEFSRVGYDPQSHCLVMKQRGRRIQSWCRVNSFQVSYLWSAACPNPVLIPAPTDWERSRWDTINSGFQNGYQCISNISLNVQTSEDQLASLALPPSLRMHQFNFPTNQ